MTNYSYDETGVYFSYFLASVLTLCLVPATYRWALKRSQRFQKVSSCLCSICARKDKEIRNRVARKSRTSRWIGTITLITGWALVAYLTWIIYSTELTQPSIWDPWKVLDLDTSATKADVRSKYRALSLQYHPDKVAEAEKEAANAKFIEIAKAYKVLTSDEAREEYDRYGHPDGKQAFSMGIALPVWLVDAHHSPLILLFYGAVFGVFLPWRIGKWWYGTQQYTKDHVMTKTMGILFKRINEDSGLKAILSVLSTSHEFTTKDIEDEKAAGGQVGMITDPSDLKRIASLEKLITAALKEEEDEWSLPPGIKKNSTAHKALVNLLAHIFRVGLPNEEQAVMAVRSVHILQRGLLQITLARGWLVPTLFSMDLSQMLVQALWHSRSPLLQAPHFSKSHVTLLEKLEPPIRNIQSLAELADVERRRVLKDLSDSQYEDLSSFLASFPRIVLEKIDFKVNGEENITPGSLVTCTLKVRLAPVTVTLAQLQEEYEARKKAEAEAKEEEEEVDALGLEGEGDGGATGRAKLLKLPKFAHSPRFRTFKRPAWWVFIGNVYSNRVINAERIADLDLGDTKTINIQFQAPNQVGNFPFSVFIKSDHYVGCDMRLDVQMVVEARKANAVVEEEDDISEPEEDTLAGQMAAMRGQRTKKQPSNGAAEEESSDSDSSSSEEEDED